MMLTMPLGFLLDHFADLICSRENRWSHGFLSMMTFLSEPTPFACHVPHCLPEITDVVDNERHSPPYSIDPSIIDCVVPRNLFPAMLPPTCINVPGNGKTPAPPADQPVQQKLKFVGTCVSNTKHIFTPYA